ncbi:MAG TPA: DsbE family thiol:disulfide interchange protein [Gammaproteobacteria bacterium]|nr:DsbE family thiol:disulfide interchange protein [Gammaproteobacteria bacterium]
MSKLQQIRSLFPFIIFSLILVLLWRGLSLRADQIPSPLINKSAPVFSLPDLFHPEKMRTNEDFAGKVVLVNVWATWCEACAMEHNLLLQLSEDEHLFFFGIDYKDNPVLAKKWLEQNGNPYQVVVSDSDGQAAIDWGVYGTPETFIIDKKGMIRYKQIGVMDADSFEKTIKPLLEKLGNEPA